MINGPTVFGTIQPSSSFNIAHLPQHGSRGSPRYKGFHSPAPPLCPSSLESFASLSPLRSCSPCRLRQRPVKRHFKNKIRTLFKSFNHHTLLFSSFDTMRFSLNILSTFLNNFRGRDRKVLSSSVNTHLPNTSGRRNPRVLRSRSARLHAAKSAARLRNHRSIANAAANSKRRQPQTAGTGTAHEVKQRGAKNRQA